MPEFEESDSQPDPQNSYTPSTGAAKSKGGRRRSGGFKSEATASNSKIGEVNPTEALKADMQKSTSQPKDTVEASTTRSTRSGSSNLSGGPNKKQMSNDATPQPEKATLDAIKQVEERIALRRAEVEKNRPERGAARHKKRPGNSSGKAGKGGFIAAVFRFFGSLLGGSSKNSAADRRDRSYGKRKPKNSGHSRRSDNPKKDASGKRYRNQRSSSKSRYKNASSNS